MYVKLTEISKESYYAALQESSDKRHAEENNYEPFVIYLLGAMAAAYREFFDGRFSE